MTNNFMPRLKSGQSEYGPHGRLRDAFLKPKTLIRSGAVGSARGLLWLLQRASCFY
ncbi:MAG: hypothetical protein WCA56_21495 [Xanthobacteraceae bacterium]